jgi:hypothetical protein
MSSTGFAARAQAAGDRNGNANASTKGASEFGNAGVGAGNSGAGNASASYGGSGGRAGPK